ncbi:MAG: hypothetical protein JWP75_420 [Frondihabitans sp.]|nr:hypothetical protein [Frondihabitans sp.]
MAAYQRERLIALGIREYVWLAGDPARCEIATRNDGKVFSFERPPPEGHPGEGECRAPDGCVCVVKPIIPGL